MKINLSSLTKTCGKGFAGIAALFGGNEVLKAALSKFATDRVQKAADDILGNSTAQAQKDIIDENYLEILCQMGEWSKENRTTIEDFRDELWEKGGLKEKRTGSDEKHAFTLAIAKMILTASEVLSPVTINTKQKNSKKGKNSLKTKITEKGISVADHWLKNFLEKYKDFDSRYLYIRKFGVFQLVEEKKIGKLEKALKSGWLTTKKESLVRIAKNLPRKSRLAIETIYNKGCAIATSEVVKNTATATVEETVKTIQFGTKTVLNLSKGFIVLFCLLIITISICEQSLLGIVIGLLPIIIIISLWWRQRKNSSTEIPEISTATVNGNDNSEVTTETTGNNADDIVDVDIVIDIDAIEIIDGRALRDGRASVILIPELNEKE